MKTFSVKNFDRFQHYKDRAPPWIKLYNELLDDYEFGALPDASKMHLVAIWLLASRSENKIPFDPEWVSRRINATEKVDLKLLADMGFIVSDQELHNTEHVASALQAECLSREEKETEKEKKETRVPALLDDWPSDYRDQFWTMYPHKVGKPDALSVLDRIRKKGVRWADLVRGLISYIRDKPSDRAWCNPATWLRQGRWDDQPANVSNANGNASSGYRADPATGRATAREAQHVTAVGNAALQYLRQSKSAGSDGETSRGFGFADLPHADRRAKAAH